MDRNCLGNVVATAIFWLPKKPCGSPSLKGDGIQQTFLRLTAASGGSNLQTFQRPKADI